MTIQTIVNAQGYVVEVCVRLDAAGGPIDYALKDGEKAVDSLNDALTVTNGIHHPPLKPRWNGTAWIDEATEAELQTAFPAATPPTDAVNDRLDTLESLIVDTQYQLALSQLGLSGEA